MKIKILIAYSQMSIGGSTTSLLSILNNFNYDIYTIDLILNSNSGELQKCIPKKVNILKPTYIYSGKTLYLHRVISFNYMLSYFKSKIIQLKERSIVHAVQFRETCNCDYLRDLKTEYDCAISFLEGLPCKYIAWHVKAKRKITWLHIDFNKVGFNPKYEYSAFLEYDYIVHVSEKCRQSFCKIYPDLASKSLVIENIIDKDTIVKLSEKNSHLLNLNDKKINIVSVTRIVFRHKGQERALKVLSQLYDKGVNCINWYIIGKGPDENALRKMIKMYHMEEYVTLLGEKANPHQYVKDMDLFFLPSKYEGKPMAVTESLMLGIPALVTNYASASEQIDQDITGFIVENSEVGIYNGLSYIVKHKEKIKQWKQNLVMYNSSNTHEIKKIYKLLK